MATPKIRVRSISLPSRILNSTNFEDELQKLNSFTKDVPISSQAIQSSLVTLAALYNSAEELVQTPSHHQDAKSMEDQLEGSIELLDSCNSIRELFQMIKENVQTLQSALRRKGSDSSIQSDIAMYVCSRKRMNKCIAKTLKTLKNVEHKNNIIGSNGEDNNSVRVLREARGVTITILKSILMYLSCPMAKSGGWSLVSKMVTKKCVDHSILNEVGCVDFALNSKALDLQTVQTKLQNLDACIEGIEEGLDRLFRQLVQFRVTLLNILTNV